MKYDDVVGSATPENDVLQFVESTYRAAATLAKWIRNHWSEQRR